MKKYYRITGIIIGFALIGIIVLNATSKGNGSDAGNCKDYEKEGRYICIAAKGKGCNREEYTNIEAPINTHHTFIYNIWAHVDQEIPYVDGEIFEMIKSAYSEIDYLAELELGNQEIYNEYLQKFWRLLQSDVAFWDKTLNREIYIRDWTEVYGGYGFDLEKRKFLFFDMNGDGAPELCIGLLDPVVVFAYDSEKDQYTLWAWLDAKSIVGTRKAIWTPEYDTIICDFFQLNEYGEVELETLFWAEFFYGLNEDINMVMFPNYLDSKKNWIITSEMKQQGVFEESSEQWFFRITDEQFAELQKTYMEAYNLAVERLRNNAYTYDELFGSFEVE